MTRTEKQLRFELDGKEIVRTVHVDDSGNEVIKYLGITLCVDEVTAGFENAHFVY